MSSQAGAQAGSLARTLPRSPPPAAAPLPAFNKLKNAGAPEFLQGLFVADKLAGAEDNQTSLATLVRCAQDLLQSCLRCARQRVAGHAWDGKADRCLFASPAAAAVHAHTVADQPGQLLP